MASKKKTSKSRKTSGKTPSYLSSAEKEYGALPQLKPADIVFVRHRKNLLRSFLRRIMGKSYWDHVALILYPRQRSKNRSRTIIVESKKGSQFSFIHTRGTAIHQLNKYLMDPKKYEIGIGRVKNLTEKERERVVTFMLMNVDAPYWPWTHWLLLVGIWSKSLAQLYLRQQRFSCSGIVQKAFYDALDWNEKSKVIFKEGIWSPIELQELTNPADIASSDRVEWVYNEH